ncbi:MAG: hypothetical protein QOK27_698, partial [Gemmatimonadales bacterium]|nr:hypothetical protein [Gemmatimonadales bacterium]
VARLALPHHAEQPGQVSQGLEALAPGDIGIRERPATTVTANHRVLERKGHLIKVSGRYGRYARSQ